MSDYEWDLLVEAELTHDRPTTVLVQHAIDAPFGPVPNHVLEDHR